MSDAPLDDDVAANPQPRFRIFTDAELREQFNYFRDRFDGDQPIYVLPARLLDAVRPFAKSWGIDWDVEQQLTNMAAERRHVGYWHHPIPCEYALFPVDLPPEDDERWRQATEATAPPHAVQRRVVGTLWTIPEYHADLAQLRSLLQETPDFHSEVVFPLHQHPLLLTRSHVTDIARKAAAQFVDALRRFLNRWQLSQFLTWDLPFPQVAGPDFAPANSLASDHSVVTFRIPTTIPDTREAKAALLEQIHRQIQARSEENQTPFALLNAGSNRAKEGEFWVAWLELILRSRLGNRTRPPGYETQAQNALANTLGVTEDEIRKRQKAIRKALKSGNLSSGR